MTSAIGHYDGTDFYGFAGIFDGNGHTISGIYIYKTENDKASSAQGVFGILNGGTVKNLTVANSTITVFYSLGAIAGYSYNSSRGNTCDGVYFKLGSDISVSTMIGTSIKPFEGNFDVDNKTITVNYVTDEECCAPFRYANGVTTWGSDYETTTNFLISDAADMAQFAYLVNSGCDFKGKTDMLTADIDLNAHVWQSVGVVSYNDYVFKGYFDGNNKTRNTFFRPFLCYSWSVP